MKIDGIIGIATCALLITACGGKSKIELETVHPVIGEVSTTVTATGTIESQTQVDVGTQVTGIVANLYADYNSKVTKGELIAEIDKVLLESDLRSADANMESARLNYEFNKSNYERDKQLHDRQLISDLEFETSKKDYEVSKAAYDKSQADRVRAAKNLTYAEIVSPIDGIVISREVEVGQTVVSNMNVANLYVIADLENMRVIGNVDEADIGRVKVGQEVTFTVDTYPDDVFEGQVTQVRLNPTTESNVVTYEVVVNVANPEMKLIPGMTANLTIYTMREDNVLTLPQKALRFTPHDYPGAEKLPQASQADLNLPPLSGENEKRVWLLKDNNLVPVTVTIGATNGTETAILSGITEKDDVAVGYTTANEGKMDEGGEGDRSPFAPRPPERNKKK